MTQVLTGREPEVARIRSCVDALTAGRPMILEVLGPAGSGKSRLLAEALRDTVPAPVTVFAGRAAAAEREIPFHVFLHALGDEADRAAGHLGQSDALWAAAGRGGPISVARYRLYRAWRRALAMRTRDGLVLVLDDLQWADPASLELIEHLIRYPVPGPLLLVLARREMTPLVRQLGDDLPWWHIALPGPDGPLTTLTAREREVADLTMTGATSRTIARQLQVSPRTVDAHLMRVYRKLGVTSRTALVGFLARVSA